MGVTQNRLKKELEIGEGNTGRKRNRLTQEKRERCAARLNEERGKITERERKVTAAERSSGV